MFVQYSCCYISARVQLFSGCKHKSVGKIYLVLVCLRCLSSIFPRCLSCLQYRAELAYISLGDVVSLTRTHTHHQYVQQQAIGCTLPHSQQYYSAHTHSITRVRG